MKFYIDGQTKSCEAQIYLYFISKKRLVAQKIGM
jgi:hypothetical protein